MPRPVALGFWCSAKRVRVSGSRCLGERCMRSFLMDIVRVRQGSRRIFCLSLFQPLSFSQYKRRFFFLPLFTCARQGSSWRYSPLFHSFPRSSALASSPPSSPTLVKARRGGFLSLFHSFPLSLVGLFSSLRLYRCSKQASAVVMGSLSLFHSFPFPFVTGYFPLMPVQARDGFYFSLSSILSSL